MQRLRRRQLFLAIRVYRERVKGLHFEHHAGGKTLPRHYEGGSKEIGSLGRSAAPVERSARSPTHAGPSRTMLSASTWLQNTCHTRCRQRACVYNWRRISYAQRDGGRHLLTLCDEELSLSWNLRRSARVCTPIPSFLQNPKAPAEEDVVSRRTGPACPTTSWDSRDFRSASFVRVPLE